MQTDKQLTGGGYYGSLKKPVAAACFLFLFVEDCYQSCLVEALVGVSVTL